MTKRKRKMATNDIYNFYDNSRLVRIDRVENFNEFINNKKVSYIINGTYK